MPRKRAKPTPSAEAEIPRLKRKLVLSLFTKTGPFWGQVQEMRQSWGITPQIQVPPSTTPPPEPGFLTRIPLTAWVPQAVLARYEEDGEEWSQCLIHWWEEIRRMQEQVMPEKYRGKGAPGDWDRFLAACVLYDPPETKLLEFAAFSDPEPEAFYGSLVPDEVDDPSKLPRMLAPPVKTLQELQESEDWKGLEKGAG